VSSHPGNPSTETYFPGPTQSSLKVKETPLPGGWTTNVLLAVYFFSHSRVPYLDSLIKKVKTDWNGSERGAREQDYTAKQRGFQQWFPPRYSIGDVGSLA